MYYVTGNEFVSLPTIRMADAAIEGLTFLHMGAKGMIHIKGVGKEPLLRPTIVVDDRPVGLANLQWSRDRYWVPQFCGEAQGLVLSGCIIVPLEERGFIYRLSVKAARLCKVQIGLEGSFGETLHEVNESKPVSGKKSAYESGWNHSFVMDFRTGLPLYALAPMVVDTDARWDYRQDDQGVIRFALWRSVELEEGEEATFDVIWGLG